jgi:hypothetical protein
MSIVRCILKSVKSAQWAVLRAILILPSLIVCPATMAWTSPQAVNETVYKEALDWNSLLALIQSRNLHSVDEVIPMLPEDFRTSFTLMKSSQSRQKSTPLRPRAILFGGSANTVVTFGGDPNLPGYNDLEVMQFNDSLQSYELHEIRFSANEVHVSTKKEIHFRCSHCHGEQPRPLYAAYRSWPHAYGSHDDYMTEMQADELSDYEKFRGEVVKIPRFAALFEKHQNDIIWPYSTSYETRTDSREPNFRLTLLLTINYAKQLAQRVSQSKLFTQFKYSLLEDMTYSSTQIFSAREMKSMISDADIPKEELWTGTRQAWIKQALSQSHHLLRFFDVPYGSSGIDPENYFGQQTNTGVNLASRGGKYSDAYLYSFLLRIVAKDDPVLWQHFLKSSPLTYPPNGSDSTYADSLPSFQQALRQSGLRDRFDTLSDAELEENAKKELAAHRLQLTTKKATTMARVAQVPSDSHFVARSILEKTGCIDCHSADSELGPLIAFSDAKLFATQNHVAAQSGKSIVDRVRERISSNDPSIRMPLGERPLEDSEAQALIEYLNFISTP